MMVFSVIPINSPTAPINSDAFTLTHTFPIGYALTEDACSGFAGSCVKYALYA